MLGAQIILRIFCCTPPVITWDDLALTFTLALPKRNMRPYYKFAAPLVEPSREEEKAWLNYRKDQIDASELKKGLIKVRQNDGK